MRDVVTPEIFERVVVPLAWPEDQKAWANDRKEFTALNESRECTVMRTARLLLRSSPVQGVSRVCVAMQADERMPSSAFASLPCPPAARSRR